MSGDTQPKKRKDKKRKKDDEDTVKETIAHAPKQPSSGAAQAAKEPGDVQMHIHSDHGTGGNWCAKVVFFILLAGLGALIGLILIENQGLSNEDTPLSESRYSEFFNGWVDETRQDDHHHEEILAAINSLDDHDDDDGEAHHVVDDHDDDEHDHDGGDGDHDDGTPYAEEEDHDDDGTDVQDDDEDEGPAQKLDDDEVEEIFTQQEAAEQQAATVDDDDDDDDDGQDDGDDDDDDAGANGNPNPDDDDDNDDKNDNFNNKQDDDNDDDDDDDDDTKTDDDKDNDELEKKSDNVITKTNLDNNDDDDDENDKDNDDDENEEAAKGKEDFDGDEDEEELVGSEQDFDEPAVRSNTGAAVADDDDDDDDVFVEGNAGFADADDDQDDNVFDEEDENDNDNFDGDEDEIEAVTRGSQSANEGNDNNVDDDNEEDDDDDDVDDGKADFSEFVDNDGGEEEYLEKIRSEQQRRAADEEKRRAAVEPEEETSQIPSRAEEADRSYQEELRRAERQLDEDPEKALAAYDRIIVQQPNSIAALIGRARALDVLAEQRRSNSILTEAITAYRKVLEQDLAVDDATLKSIAERCLDRMRFQGQHAKAIEIHKMLIRRFDNEPLYRNQLAVSYLYMNRLQEAKAVLHDTLLRWIGDGFALVHYGFVLKTLDQNMELAAQYLQEGIDTDHEGTQDGRFYFQLGDALQRLGRNSEALNVYRKGVEKKLFLSLYQRSLYNVDGLRSRPFWTQEQTTHGRELELIRAQWTQIRDEGLALLSSEGVFVNETENLRDRGDWKQLELFSRGARLERNCARAPLTCRLVEQHFPAARSCKRGQVKFSVMHPGTHVWPHCGPTNCRVRAHLGLSVPAGTSIRVAEETRSWENGKWLIFDDSFEHEVWHNGTATRLVLIVDFWHPDLSESQRRTLTPI